MPEHIRITEDGGADVEVAHRFNDVRAIVKYRGLFVFADRLAIDLWELSGIPAREDEKAIHARLVATVETTTTVTKDES